MIKWIPLTIVTLVLACIRVLVIITSSVGMLLFNGMLYGQLGNMFYYANSALHLFILFFLAFGLNIIKENIWCSIAYVAYALMSIPFIVLGTLQISDPKIWGAVSVVNLVVMVFFTVQSFLVKNLQIRGAIRWYSIILMLLILVSMAIPYISSIMALPMHYVQFTSIVYVIPAGFQIYLIYLFYQYFSAPAIPENNGFVNQL